VKGRAGDRIYRGRERELGAVTASGNVEGTVTAQHNSSDTACAASLLLRREQQGTEFIEGERERGVGAVTTGGNVEGTVTAQHNSDTVCVLLCYCCEGNSRGLNL